MNRTARQSLLALTLVSSVGIAIELILNRHWTEPSQLVAWVALAFVALGAVSLLGSPNAATVRVIRAGIAIVIVASLVGVVLHAHGNYEAGPLDAIYGDRWETMSATARWWAAFRQQVGPSPVIVPLALAQLALMVGVATIEPRGREPLPD